MGSSGKLTINRERLWQTLMDLARIGATEKGGVCRLALTDLDRQARDLFIAWSREAGCRISIDRIGNIFARRPGRNNDLPPVMVGSHIDTQPTGGKFDGNYGVMAGLEIVRTLNEQAIDTEAPIEVVVWTNEEGSRFAPAMMGSGVFAGAFPLDYALRRCDLDDVPVAEALSRIGYAGDAEVGGRAIGAYFEAHIEQGPVLEQRNTVIGVVTGALGRRWYDVVVVGQEGHAGSSPMGQRTDALLGASELVGEVNRIAQAHQPDGRGTVGFMQVMPNSRNVIPGEVRLSVDLRHSDEAVLDAMETDLGDSCKQVASRFGLSIAMERIVHSAPAHFDSGCIATVRKGAERFGLSHIDIVSGAGHDAVYLAAVAPTGMIFVPCEGGISHNEIENASADDLADGCNVLLHALLERAGAAH